MSQNDLELLEQGGLLHDTGKSKAPEHLLRKPGGLDETEWEERCGSICLIDPCIINIAEHYHEKMDSSGYRPK